VPDPEHLVRGHGLDTAAAERIFPVLNTAEADAFICIWDANRRISGGVRR
jgi:hypothetical protein